MNSAVGTCIVLQQIVWQDKPQTDIYTYNTPSNNYCTSCLLNFITLYIFTYSVQVHHPMYVLYVYRTSVRSLAVIVFTSAYCQPPAPPLPHPVLYPPPQKQYVFIHDALVEFIKSRSHLVTAAELKARVANMAAVNPKTNMTGFQQEYQVSTHHVHSLTGPREKCTKGKSSQSTVRTLRKTGLCINGWPFPRFVAITDLRSSS